MFATMRIAEVADRSGFSAATLRYYEQLGLVPGPALEVRAPPEAQPVVDALFAKAAGPTPVSDQPRRLHRIAA